MLDASWGQSRNDIGRLFSGIDSDSAVANVISYALIITTCLVIAATVITPILTGGLVMALVIRLWVRAWQEEQPGVGLVLAAIMVSFFAAALKTSSLQFTLGSWEFDPNSIYHLAQIPGLFLLLAAIQRRAGVLEDQPARQIANVAAPV